MKKSLVFDLEFELTGVQCMICEAARCIFPKLIFNFQQELDFFCSQSRHFKGRPLKTTSFKTSLKDMYYYKLADFPIAHPSLFLQILTSISEDRPNTTLRCDLCKTRPSKMEVSPSKSAQNGQKMPRVANLKKIYLKLFWDTPYATAPNIWWGFLKLEIDHYLEKGTGNISLRYVKRHLAGFSLTRGESV